MFYENFFVFYVYDFINLKTSCFTLFEWKNLQYDITRIMEKSLCSDSCVIAMFILAVELGSEHFYMYVFLVGKKTFEEGDQF